MAFYIKVRVEVADYLKLTTERNRTKDGCVLLWQADVVRFPGDTIFERASYAGGVALTPQSAKEETDGTDYPAEVSLPEWLQPAGAGAEEPTEEPTEEPDGASPDGDEPVTGEEVQP